MILAPLFIALAILGIFDTSYLYYKHLKRKEQKLVCPIGEDCESVTESKWSKFLGVRNEIWGFLYYLFLATSGTVLALELTGFNAEIELALRFITGFGVLYSAFLVYVQAYILKNFCIYCIASALLSTGLFIIALMF